MNFLAKQNDFVVSEIRKNKNRNMFHQYFINSRQFVLLLNEIPLNYKRRYVVSVHNGDN